MEKNSVKINVPEGYEIDKEKSTFEEIVFKKIDNKPRTWKEYCENNTARNKWFITSASTIVPFGNTDGYLSCKADKTILNSKEEAEAFIALMQLRVLRKAWVGDWEPDWEDGERKWVIYTRQNMIEYIFNINVSHPLSFPTKEMVKEFMYCFKDLLEQAKILL